MASLNTTGEQLSPAPPPTVHLPLDTGYSAMAAHEELQRLKDMHHGATQRRRGSVIRRQDLAKAKLAQRLSIKKGKAMKKFGALNAFARGLKGDWKVASMSTARGDIFAAVADEYVYITGGFTHEDYWCAPHASVEKWHIGTSEWSAVPDMNYKRGDKALMHMNQQIYAIGGESKVKTDDCNNQPANASMAVEHVEIYNELTNTWTDATVLPEETFRFVAVAHEPSDSIYIFGGQNYYNASCDCYPVSEKALKFVDSDWTIDNIDAPAATVGARGLGAAAAAALMAAGLMFW